MEKFKAVLDSDVIINWLTKEEDFKTKELLWYAPYKIIKLVENGKIDGIVTILSLLEIRYVLRRKKQYPEEKIRELFGDIISNLKVLIPDEICLLKANELQTENFLDPFDSIMLGLLTTLEKVILITRDVDFIKIAKKYILVKTPEEFLKSIE